MNHWGLDYEIPDILDHLNNTRKFVNVENQEELIALICAQCDLNENQAQEILRLFFEEWITAIMHGYHMELKCGDWRRPQKRNGAPLPRIKFTQSESLRKKLGSR